MKLRTNQLMPHHLLLINIHPRLLVNGDFAPRLNGIVLDFREPGGVGRVGPEFARVLDGEEGVELGFGRFEERDDAEVDGGVGVGGEDCGAGGVRFGDG